MGGKDDDKEYSVALTERQWMDVWTVLLTAASKSSPLDDETKERYRKLRHLINFKLGEAMLPIQEGK